MFAHEYNTWLDIFGVYRDGVLVQHACFVCFVIICCCVVLSCCIVFRFYQQCLISLF